MYCGGPSSPDRMCDMGYLIADHVTSLMQVVTNELPQYTMQVITTKCLNTAVMIMYLFLGRAALEHTEFCDVTNVRARRAKSIHDPSKHVMQALIDDALGGHDTDPMRDAQALKNVATGPPPRPPGPSKPSTRVLYYVMITNGLMPHVTPLPAGVPVPPPRMFPGHVFVIERLPRGTFNLYQSYINHFKLNDVVKINSSFSLSHSKLSQILKDVQSIFTRRVWDAQSTTAWKQLSHVSETRFEGHMFGGNVLMCYTRKDTNKCIGELRTFVHRVITALEPVSSLFPDAVYGDSRLYAPSLSGIVPLSNAAMLDDLRMLRDKL